MSNKNLGRWAFLFVVILVVPFIVIGVIPLFFGLPIKFFPIQIMLEGIVIAWLYNRYLKK